MQKKSKNHLIFRSFGFLFLIVTVALTMVGCERRKTIVNAIDEKEANEITVFLSNKGIDAYKIQSPDVGGVGARKIILWDISVPAYQATEALSILNKSGLPRRRGLSLLGIFAETGLVPSEMQEKIRYQAGLAEQIAGIIRKIDGVLDAEVQISFPEEDPLNPGKTKGDITASVYVKHSGVLDDPNTHLLTKIKRLVAASITGLSYDNVTVIGDRARFTELYPIPQAAFGEEEKELVRVWGIIIAKESITQFRILFFSFIILILLLILTTIWGGWKIYPLLSKYGGAKALFQIKPLKEEEKEAIEEKEEEKEEEEEKEDKTGVT